MLSEAVISPFFSIQSKITLVNNKKFGFKLFGKGENFYAINKWLNPMSSTLVFVFLGND